VSSNTVGWAFEPLKPGECDPAWRRGNWDGVMWESDPIRVYQCSEAILSWSASTPEGSGLRFDISVLIEDVWTPWEQAGEWGICRAPARQDSRMVRDIDVCRWDGVADALCIRCTAVGDGVPFLRRVVVACGDSAEPGDCECKVASSVADVPFRSQFTEREEIAGRICGPTSLAMILAASGRVCATADVALHCYDPSHDVFGNWARIAAVAGDYGLVAWVQRLPNLASLHRCVEVGYLPIVSVAYGPGELNGSPISDTKGHLLVVRGFDGNGDVICNDPAFRDDTGDGVAYNGSEFTRTWIGHGGAVILTRQQ
jgi:hypothetical protein